MVYRIRFRSAAEGRESDALVEAGSPTEAMVKFRHTHGGRFDRDHASRCITSVVSEVELDQPPCPDPAEEEEMEPGLAPF